MAKKTQQKVAKTEQKDYQTPKSAGTKIARSYSVPSSWRQLKGEKLTYQGIAVFAPVDPYKTQERKEFRTAVENPHIYRSIRIMTTFVAGQGYTTQVVPRSEEELPQEQREAFSTTKYKVPYWDNKECTADEIKDWVDKLVKKLDLQTNVYNGYATALEQGRCVVAITPLAKGDDDRWQMPEQLRLIRPELTMRPLLDENSQELLGVQAVGVKSADNDNVIPAERMLYLMHGFNNELYSDYYGDSKIARVSDIANGLNVIYNQDFPNAAKHAWSKPRVFAVPIPPQEFGNEAGVLQSFIDPINEAEGKDVAVTGATNKDDIGVQVISNTSASGSDISGLEVIRSGLVKAIITAFGIPAFMLSEGDFGPLGGNTQLIDLDAYLNTEIKPERLVLEQVIENQLYDRILCVLFCVDDAKEIPIKITHTFNKPKLWTLLSPEMFGVLERMVVDGLIDPDGIREILGLEELDKETMSASGTDTNPQQSNAGNTGPPVNGWGQEVDEWGKPIQKKPWGTMPRQSGWDSSKGWRKPNTWVTRKRGW